MTGIQRHWHEQQTEQVRAFALFCEMVSNDTDRWIMRSLGVSLGPYPIEHDINIPRGK